MGEADKKNLRNFGLVLGAVFLILGLRLFFKFHKANFLYLGLIIGCFFVISGLAFPFILRPVYKIASFIMHSIVFLTSRLTLILAFYFVVAPTGLFMRLIGRDLLGLKIDKSSSSYWIKRPDKVTDPKQYEKQF